MKALYLLTTSLVAVSLLAVAPASAAARYSQGWHGRKRKDGSAHHSCDGNPAD